MAEDKRSLFRKEALERMSSPERLDQLIQIVAPKDWLMAGTLLALMLAVLGWCIWGRLPVTVTGNGVIVRPRKIVEIQSAAAGRLARFGLQAGDEVRPGEILGVIDQTEIRRQLEDDRAQLAELETQDRKKNAFEESQTRLEARDEASQREYLALQAANQKENLKNAEALEPVLKRRVESLREAVYQGLEPKISGELLQAEREHYDNQALISNLHAQLAEIESQVKLLDTKRTERARELLEASTARKNQMLELRKNIGVHEVQLERNTEILCGQSGRVLEVVATPGQVVAAGMRLATLEAEQAASDLVSVSYFPVRDGKRIRPGMKVQVTPDTVKRERFGGILGVVASVSTFPVTKEGAALLVGNPEVASELLKEEPRIEVVADLEKDPSTPSGYKWSSSRGPRLPVTAGTTTSGRVTIEERSPVSYVLPFLREISGAD